MIVSMWMSRELITIPPETLVADAAELMSRRHVRRLLVVHAGSAGDRLAGIITATDVLHAFPPDVNPFAAVRTAAERTRTLVSDLITAEPVTVAADAPIEQAAALMAERKIGALPVLREGRLVGLITESDIFRAFVSVFSSAHGGARLTFEIGENEDAFRFVAGITRKYDVRVASLVTSRQHDSRVCVVRLEGPAVEKLLDELWSSKHRVLNVVTLAPSAAAPS